MIRTRIRRQRFNSVTETSASLVQPVRDDDIPAAVENLRRGADPDELVEPDLTALADAAGRGHLEMVRLLLAHGADPGGHPTGGYPPLVMAAANGHLEIVRELLRAGAPICQHTGHEGVTPLHAATQNGQAECVHLLLGRGARRQQRDRAGQTPLHYAAASAHPPTITALLAAGADLMIRDRRGNTPLHLLIRGELVPGWHRRGFQPSDVFALLLDHAVRTGAFTREFKNELLRECREGAREDYRAAVAARAATRPRIAAPEVLPSAS